jgi:hypothetical protein
VSGIYGIEGLQGPDALFSPWLRELTTTFFARQHSTRWAWWPVPDDFPRIDPLLDLAGVRYLLTDKPGEFTQGGDGSVALQADLAVVRRKDAWPRAFFTSGLVPYTDVSDFVQIASAAPARPIGAIQRSEISGLGKFADLVDAAAVVGDARDYALTPNTTRFSIDAPSRGMAVLMEAFWPGHEEVLVNGEPAEPVRVNHGFIGIPIEKAGKYDVVVRYRPAIWPLAVKLFAVGAVGLLGFLALAFASRGMTKSEQETLSANARQ